MAATAVIVGSIAAGGAAVGYSVQNTDRAQRRADAARIQQEDKQKQLEKELKAKQATEDATKTRDEARRRQRQLAAGAQGRNDTILTSPLGDTGVYTGQAKTALGT